MSHTWTKRLLILGVYIPPRRYAPAYHIESATVADSIHGGKLSSIARRVELFAAYWAYDRAFQCVAHQWQPLHADIRTDGSINNGNCNATCSTGNVWTVIDSCCWNNGLSDSDVAAAIWSNASYAVHSIGSRRCCCCCCWRCHRHWLAGVAIRYLTAIMPSALICALWAPMRAAYSAIVQILCWLGSVNAIMTPPGRPGPWM